MRIAICEDDPKDLDYLCGFLRRYHASLATDADVFSTANSLLEACLSNDYDIILLDIELPDLTGYQAAKTLAKNHSDHPLIIFTTKSTAYSIRGYDVAFQYLVKPIPFSKFCSVMDEAIRVKSPQKFSFVCQGDTFFVPIQDIYYVEVLKFTTTIHCKTQDYHTRLALKKAAAELEPVGFFRTHNSFLVNMRHVDRISADTAYLSNGDKVPISRARKKEFNLSLHKFLG